ncbi:hypothetical protein, partial [Pseudomonas donghuensis]|uniref:hypothetical protein n=1 Tax=Pseudomonas donghuensis TaxID=1163398 RepID=UPI001ED97924
SPPTLIAPQRGSAHPDRANLPPLFFCETGSNPCFAEYYLPMTRRSFERACERCSNKKNNTP